MDTLERRITTSDNKKYVLPQWKIESSRVIHTKQQWQLFKQKYKGAKPAPLLLKTIPSYKLELYCQAVKEKDFPDYFKKLSSAKQQQLKCVAGENELNDPTLTIKLANSCLIPEIAKQINSHIPIVDAINHLQYLVILDNCKQKKFVQTESNYNGKGSACMVPMGAAYRHLPKLLREQTNFSGEFQSITCKMKILSQKLESSEENWWLNNYAVNPNVAMYFLTPLEPTNEKDDQEDQADNKKKLWAIFSQEDTSPTKIIEHNNFFIELSAFSKNGKYLATSSEGPHSELVLTDLAVENGAFVHPDLFLTGFDGTIDKISFNNQSTLLAALSGNRIYFYDAQTHTLLTTFDYPLLGDGYIDFIFNKDDSRLVITSWNNPTLTSTVTLWDITNITHIARIKSITLEHSVVSNAHFTPSEDMLIIETGESAILLDGQTGNTIMKTESLQQSSHGGVYAVLMEQVPLLATVNQPTNPNDCIIALWDITSDKRIATLLEKESNLRGVGATADGRSIVAIKPLCNMIKVDLYNDTIANSLDWSRDKMDLSQQYLLLRLYRASKLNDSAHLHADCFESHVLQALPVDFKELINKYLLKIKKMAPSLEPKKHTNSLC